MIVSTPCHKIYLNSFLNISLITFISYRLIDLQKVLFKVFHLFTIEVQKKIPLSFGFISYFSGFLSDFFDLLDLLVV